MNTLLNKYIHFLDKYYKSILAFIVLITLFFGFFLKDIAFDTNWRIWYTKDTLVKYDNYVDEFSYDDAVIIAFEDKKGIFNKNALSSIIRLTKKLEQIKYISKVDSLTNYQYVYTKDDELVVENFIKNLDNKEILYKKSLVVDELNIMNRLIGNNLNSTMIIARISSEVNEIKKDTIHEMMNKVYRIIEEENKYNNYSFHIHGGPEITMAFERLAEYDIAIFVPLIFLSMILLLYIIFKSLKGIVIPLSIVFLTIILTISIESFLGHKLNNFTANIPLFIIAIGLADTIHMYSTYLRIYDKSIDNLKLVYITLSKNIKPLFLTSLTTAIGFYSLKFSPIEPVQLLGESIFIAVIIAFFLTLTIVPIFLLRTKQSTTIKSISTIRFNTLNLFIGKYYKSIILIFIIGLSSALYGIKYIKIDSNLMEYFDKNVDIQKSLAFIQKNITGPVTYEIVVDSKTIGGIKDPKFLTTIENFNLDLKNNFSDITKTFSIINVIKQTNKAFNSNNQDSYVIPKSKNEIAQYLLLYELSMPSGSNIQDLKNVNEQLLKLTLHVNLLGTQKDLEILNWIEDWWSKKPYSIEINGSYALFAKMQNSVSNTLVYSLYFTLGFLILILLVAFRKINKLYIYLLPNILPVVLAFGFMGWLGISMDLGIAISLAIILSIAVDDTLHFLSKFYEYKNENKSTKESIDYAFTYAGTGIILTTIIISLSFAIFSFSDFTPNKYFGIITSLSLIMALIVDLLLLPSLLYFSYRSKDA
jgi:predicted RND superfamily exporter protein